MQTWKGKELIAKRAIEDQGFMVHDANIVFRENSPNIDLIVFSRTGALYVQVKSSTKPASRDAVLIDGSPWTEDQLFNGAPIFNKHGDHFQASYVVIVDTLKTGELDFYVAPPDELARVAVEVGRKFWTRPKRDGQQRKPFRKEVPRELLSEWRKAWGLLGGNRQ